MRIVESFVGDVTVLALKGRIMLGEREDPLKECVNRLLASGRMNMVFDFESVPYIDSAGNGAIFRAYGIVRAHGGRLAFCSIPTRIKNVFSITNVLPMYETYDSVTDALRSFGTPRFEVSCPVCRPVSWNRLLENTGLATCGTCDVRFQPVATEAILAQLEGRETGQTGQNATTPVKLLWWTTYREDAYARERVTLSLGRPTTLAIIGRLDRFALDVVETAWRSIPQPRRVVFDTTLVSTVSPAAIRRLREFCASGDGDRAVIWTRSASDGSGTRRHSRRHDTYLDRDRAIQMLGNLEDGADSIEVCIRRLVRT